MPLGIQFIYRRDQQQVLLDQKEHLPNEQLTWKNTLECYFRIVKISSAPVQYLFRALVRLNHLLKTFDLPPGGLQLKPKVLQAG